MLRFLHIQKTAGNSLVCGLQEEFGKEHVYNANIDMRDGGADLVIRVAHEIRAAVVFFHGEFQSMKFFEPEETFVFFRDPVQRVISNFNHYLRGGGRRKFNEFVLANENFQSRVTAGLDLDRAFVGLTEQFDESLRRFNRCFGTKVRQHHVNVNPLKDFAVRYQPTEFELDWIKRCNQHDLELYARVKRSFDSACVVSETPPYFTRPGTWDKKIFDDVVRGEYGPILFKDKRVFDVGAHIGGFSYLALRSGASHVHAFEPVPSNFRVLELNMEEFGDLATCHNHAVWRSDRQEAIGWAGSVDDVTNTGGAGTAVLEQQEGLTPVASEGLDALIHRYGVPDILKLDCEAAEYQILPSSQLFDRIGLIVGEYHPPADAAPVLFRILQDRGYDLDVRPHVNGFGKFTARRRA